MKSFNIPGFYKSEIISKVKELRRNTDPRKKDYNPTLLDFGPVNFFIVVWHYCRCKYSKDS